MEQEVINQRDGMTKKWLPYTFVFVDVLAKNKQPGKWRQWNTFEFLLDAHDINAMHNIHLCS